MTNILNPFLYGKPVPPGRFIGRRDAVRTIFSRLYNGDSTAIIGEPHIGKSSLLMYVADDAVRSEWLGELATQYVFVEVDCHMFPHHFGPADFWRVALMPLQSVVTDETLRDRVQAVSNGQFDAFSLASLFRALGRAQWRLVLLIDEFDTLLDHPNFDLEFYAPLRSMTTRTEGLSVITASRLSVTAMNRRSQEINPLGSPFFNNITEVQLRPLSKDESRILIDETLDKSTVVFDEEDYAYIYKLTGGQPFLVQTAAAGLFDGVVEGKTGKSRYQRANQLFRDRAEAHFNDYWRNLENTEQTVLMMLGLGEVIGRLQSDDFDNRQFNDMPWLDSELRHLSEAGIVEEVTQSDQTAEATILQDKRWRIRRRGLVWWLTDNAVAQTRQTVALDPWLDEKIGQGLLKNEHANQIRTMADRIPQTLAAEVEQMSDLLIAPGHERQGSVNPQLSIKATDINEKIDKTTILFLASEPVDMVRLRVGKEVQEIRKQLQLAQQRDNFSLEQRSSVRTADISQDLLDFAPQIVHFSGHGSLSGELYFENVTGESFPVAPEALSELFEQFSDKVNCVILNACFSKIQAQAIAKHIDFVIGIDHDIEDVAAIAFSVGFYQALGAGGTIPAAYKLGRSQAMLQGVPKHLTPVLIKKRKPRRL